MHAPACHDPDVSRGGNSSAVRSLCIDQRQVCQPADTQRFLGQEHHLRALAVYHREPIYVWITDRAGTAHVQQYSFLNFSLPNGDAHETGIVQVLGDEQAGECLNAKYFR